MKKAKEVAISLGQKFLGKELLEEFSKDYDEIMSYADKECPPPEFPKERKRGKIRRGKTRALIEQLKSSRMTCAVLHITLPCLLITFRQNVMFAM